MTEAYPCHREKRAGKGIANAKIEGKNVIFK